MNTTEQDLAAMDQEEFDNLVENYDQLDELSQAVLVSYVEQLDELSLNTKISAFVKRVSQANSSADAKATKTLRSIERTHGKKGTKKATTAMYAKGVSEQTLELIDAIDSGSTLDINGVFNEIMANKLVDAIEHKREEIAANLFTVA